MEMVRMDNGVVMTREAYDLLGYPPPRPGTTYIKCKSCPEPYEDFGDGYDGECPSCADASYIRETTENTPERDGLADVLPFKPRRLND